MYLYCIWLSTSSASASCGWLLLSVEAWGGGRLYRVASIPWLTYIYYLLFIVYYIFIIEAEEDYTELPAYRGSTAKHNYLTFLLVFAFFEVVICQCISWGLYAEVPPPYITFKNEFSGHSHGATPQSHKLIGFPETWTIQNFQPWKFICHEVYLNFWGMFYTNRHKNL